GSLWSLSTGPGRQLRRWENWLATHGLTAWQRAYRRCRPGRSPKSSFYNSAWLPLKAGGLFQKGCGRFYLNKRDNESASLCGLYLLPLGLIQRFQCVVASLDVNIRLRRCEKAGRRGLGKNANPVHTFEGSQHRRAVALDIDRAIRSFKLPHRPV